MLKQFGKRGAQMLVTEVGKETLNDYNKKNERWNDRMNNFARNLNQHFRQHKALYAEERDIANRNTIEDRWGLRNAYASKSGLYRTGSTLYISGTGGKDGSIARDVLDELLLLPTRNVGKTEKYRDVMAEFKKAQEITRLVSHSLGSAVVNKINEEQPDRFATTTYATPTIKAKRKGTQNPLHKDCRNKGDIVSELDGYAIAQDIHEFNPLITHTLKTFEENGLWEMNAGTNISI